VIKLFRKLIIFLFVASISTAFLSGIRYGQRLNLDQNGKNLSYAILLMDIIFCPICNSADEQSQRKNADSSSEIDSDDIEDFYVNFKQYEYFISIMFKSDISTSSNIFYKNPFISSWLQPPISSLAIS